MLVENIASLLSRHRTLVLFLVVLTAYSVAVPPAETFGSHDLERIKDALAFGFAFLGLALRCVASGARLDRSDFRSPFYVANVVILFGIFLMHGNGYVVAFGLVTCAMIYLLMSRSAEARGELSWASLFGGEKPLRLRLRDALAREWLTITLTVALLLLTESYEEMSGSEAASFQLALLGLSGTAMLVSGAALFIQLRGTMGVTPSFGAVAPAATASQARRRTFPLRLSKNAADALLIPWARGFLWMAAFVLQFRTPYHPIGIAGGRAGKRETEIRWAAIASIIEAYRARSILDVGCAEGWFLRHAAEEFNCFGLGVDSYESRVLLGEAVRLHAGDDRVAIMKGKLTPGDVRDLPSCDVVLCLSVLHWVIRSEGLAAAQDFVRALASRSRKALIFEIGAAESFAKKFARLLPPNPSGEDFVRYLLTSSGVSNIRVIASSPDINNAQTRLLFVGEPA